MGFRVKTDTLRRLFSQRCKQTNLDASEAMNTALETCESAGAARNDLVHGLADYVDGAVITVRPGGKSRPITLDEVCRVNELVSRALREIYVAFCPLWKATKERFE